MNRQKKRGQTGQIIWGVVIVGFVILGGWLIGKANRPTSDDQTVSSTQTSQVSSTSTSSTVISEEPVQTSTTTQQEEPVTTEPTQPAGMQTQSLLAGDFSAIAGTWSNGYGHRLTFTATGLIEESGQLQGLAVSEYGGVEGYLILGTTGGGTIEFLPAGVRLPDYSYDRDGVATVATDGSDNQVDRIWVGQDFTMIADAASYYYLVNP